MAQYFGSCASYCAGDDATFLRSNSVATALLLTGVLMLTDEQREAIRTDPKGYAGLFDMDGTLCAAGAPIGPRAAEIIQRFNARRQPVGVITAQAQDYLIQHGGYIFLIRITEKSHRIVYAGSEHIPRQPLDTSAQLASTIAFLNQLGIPYGINHKETGFAVNMIGAPASYQLVENFMRTLLTPGYVVDATAGFIDFGDAAFNKQTGLIDALRIAGLENFKIIVAGNGSTDVPMFTRADMAIGVNRTEASVDVRVSSHEHVLDILEYWLHCLEAVEN